MTTIEDLYKHFSVLADAKEKAGEHEAEYRAIIGAIKNNNNNEKRLASQFTTRFFKFFPRLAEESLQALFALCEDPDATIRKQVIKDLGTICRDSPQYTERVAHIVTGLLQTSDTTELSIVHMTLVTLLRADPKGAMAGIFGNIINDEGLIRDRAINFLSAKTKLLLAEDVLHKDNEEVFIQHCRKVLEDVTGDEFKIFMRILALLPSMSTVQGRQNLLDIIVTEADLKSKFEPHSDDCLDRIISCIIEALPLFSKNVHSTKFVEYLCLNILPVFQQIGYAANSEEQNKQYQIDVLKYLAEIVSHCGEMTKTEECVLNVYNCLIDFMPSPEATDLQTDKLPNVEYLIVECLMYTFHQLARRCPQWLTNSNNAERLKDFRLRLQHLAGTIKGSLKYVKDRLEGKAGEISESEKKQFSLTVESTNNLNALVKDLFYNPPAYKTIITLSFKKQVQQKTGLKQSPSTPVAGVKRPAFTPVTFDSGEPQKKSAKTEQKMYAPPGGKFSEKVGAFPAEQGANQRGRRGGTFKRW